jgi:hypothetical protein
VDVAILVAVRDAASATVQDTVDAFIEAAEAARRQLIRAEGRDVSWREVIRRAGYSESERARVAYHLNTTKQWPKGHNVPAEIVSRLAAALQTSEQDLQRAARVAAGFNVVDETSDTDAVGVVSRFYGSEDVSEEEKAEVTARLLEIIAEESRRGRP